jgi:hypothetical protein
MLGTQFETDLLNLWLRNVAIAGIGDAGGLQPSAVAGNVYVSAMTAWPGEAGAQNTNEASYTGYTRAAVVRGAGWAAASSGAISPAAAISFGERSDAGAQQDLFYFGIGDASSGAGTLRMWGVFGDLTFGVRTFVAADTAGDTITIPGHGLAADARIAFFQFEAGGSFPTGLTEGTVYFVRSGGLTTDAFTVATTSGGAAVNITAVGAGYAAKIIPAFVTQNVTPQLKATTVIRFS